ncbi:hypothetical protein BJP32_16090 [Brevundimonas sp. ZS04]|nr:hypothetical protein BJP32_16090 [Brevundimonas sp. ZS04]
MSLQNRRAFAHLFMIQPVVVDLVIMNKRLGRYQVFPFARLCLHHLEAQRIEQTPRREWRRYAARELRGLQDATNIRNMFECNTDDWLCVEIFALKFEIVATRDVETVLLPKHIPTFSLALFNRAFHGRNRELF